jgi:hypothetical protein
MIKLNLQMFGGGKSGLDKASPGGGGGSEGGDNDNYSNGLGFQNEDLRQSIGKRSRPMGIARAAKGANPNYNSEYADFSENCQRAVSAYEMRRRGYNVTAEATYKNDILPTTAYRNPRTNAKSFRFTGAFQHAKTEAVRGTTPQAMRKDFEAKMKKYGPGSRAFFTFGWKGAHYGHVINVENQGGKIRYIDAQVGKEYDGKELFNRIRPDSANVTRVDNLRISARMAKSVTKRYS